MTNEGLLRSMAGKDMVAAPLPALWSPSMPMCGGSDGWSPFEDEKVSNGLHQGSKSKRRVKSWLILVCSTDSSVNQEFADLLMRSRSTDWWGISIDSGSGDNTA